MINEKTFCCVCECEQSALHRQALWLAASSAHLLPSCLSPAQALDPTELKSEGLLLSLEDQLSALTLSELQNSEPSATVSLNGECFKVELFEDTRESTKVLCRLCSGDRAGLLTHLSKWAAL